MLSKNIRRCLSFVIALVMVFALTSFQALGAETETDGHDHENETQTTAAPESTAASEPALETGDTLAQIQTEIDDILTLYLGTTEMSAEDISAKVAAMAWETFQSARSAISELENSDEIQQLTETELQTLLDDNAVLCAFSDALEAKAAADTSVSLLTTVNVLDGQVSVTDTANSNTVSGGTVTITAKGSLFSKATNTVTITNETESTATLSFDYTASTYNSFTVAGASASASGTYSGLLDPGASVSVVIKSNSGFSNLTATLTLSNFSLTVAAAASNVTFNYDSALGSITVGGTAVDSGTTQEVSLADGAALEATANSGTTFLGWINEADGSVLSTAASYTLTPAQDMTVKAVFTKDGGTLWFGIGAMTESSFSTGILGMDKKEYYTVSSSYAYLFDDLNAAATAAHNNTFKGIVPLNNGTLPAGNYTIPADVTLLIPFDASNTLYTTAAQSVSTHGTPTKFRTMTMADGANLIINGSMSLSAKHTYAAGSSTGHCEATGACSFVQMQGNSSITVNNGGKLYVYGFITGSGSVTANSGATIYELFQFTDFRGGTQTTDMENRVFPFNQYYIQSIEVPLTMHAGATEMGFTSIYMSSSTFAVPVPFIGTKDSVFTLTDGYVVKTYDGSLDRMLLDAYGTVSLSSITIPVSGTDIDAADYDFPLTSNITVAVRQGSSASIDQNMALFPGSEVIIETGATCTIKKPIYVYDADNWGNFCSHTKKKMIPLCYAPGRTCTRTEADLVDATVLVNGTVTCDVSGNNSGYIYTTAGGANIYSTGGGEIKAIAGEQTVTYQLVQGTDYTEIPLTPAKLKNADGSYTETAGATEAVTYEYVRVDNSDGEDVLGHWHKTFTVDDTRYRYFDIVATNVAVNDGLDLYFYVYDACLNEDAKYTATVTKDFADGRSSVTETFSSDEWTTVKVDGIQYRRFKFSDISAKEMTDNINAAISLSGTPITTLDETIQAYAIRTLDEYADSTTAIAKALKTALIDMLNYGADAQTYFRYNEDNLANVDPDGVTTIENMKGTYQTSSDPEFTPETISGTNLKAVSVSAKNKLMLTFYFDFGGVDPNDAGYTATISYTDRNGKPQSQTIETFYDPENSSYFGVDVEGISMTNGRSVVTCTVKDANDNTVGSGKFSVQGYVARNNGDVYTSLIKFVDSACAYFDAVRNA